MLGAIKTIGSVVTLVSSAQFGKEVYDKYKDKRKKRQIEEVHEFIKNLDLVKLQDAITSKDNDALIDAVENIMKAADTVKLKSEFEELKEDASEIANKVFNTVTGFTDKILTKTVEKLDNLSDYGHIETPSDEPTFDEFINGKPLIVEIDKKMIKIYHTYRIVSVNAATKTVFIFGNDGAKEFVLK